MRRAFTLIEVLISIVLLGLIIPALYESVDMLRNSNKSLRAYLQKSQQESRAIQMLYLDIASSDGNLTIKDDTFDRVCIGATQNSLYGLASPKVCWIVMKEKHRLVRVEGYDYHLPLKEEEHVGADLVMNHMELFDLYWQKDKVVVMLKQKDKTPVSFLVQGITKPKKKPKKPKKPKNLKSPKPLQKPQAPATTKTKNAPPPPSKI